MSELNWLVGHRFQSLTRRDYAWVFDFDREVNLVVGCLWRLVEAGRIRLTSQDDGHQFGLPSPIEAASEINRHIANSTVVAVELKQGLLDLELQFATGHRLQFIADSSGYEAWNLYQRNRQYIAVGGGELAIVDDDEFKRND